MPSEHIIVIGAGIVGASSAIWLRRAGYEVTLLDRGQPGMGASYGNGGILASCSIVPVTGPGLLKKSPAYLADPNFPLFLRWGYVPKLVPWLIKYMSNANESDTRRISQGLATIVGDSLEQHQALTTGTRAAKWVQESDYSFAYPDRSAFEADAFAWQLRREAGFEPSFIEGNAVQEAEPILGPKTKLLAVLKNHGFILNPGSYVGDLVELLKEMGGKFVQAEVKDFELAGGQVSAVDTNVGRIHCDKAVVSSGVWSKPLMQKLGLNVPLEAERGYHIMFKNPNLKPNNPMMLTAGKFVTTAMDQGVRCAGVVEFGGLSETLSKAPLKLLRRKAQAMFPDLTYGSDEEWLGYRPAPSDSLPLIGELRETGVFTAFGHHHIGLTGGPKTGRLVADMIAGNHTNNDIRPFEPMRFAVGK
ncbi:FAD-binding oxidoreductase [Aliiroseovarius sp. M344]|uniref:NAD(P)/FAD-dependent oxidoreductase n=1 Tax=Aliiroseovarius sp. M344 TaxID=2867010 RepID=UPI0021AE1DB3|nr:FAD-binding oxidoreductase [Aliiroseovarius sp. M344]UWQ13046.1 FAD-binding oxidoreductase [Aliiroseovarius sp. M344]